MKYLGTILLIVSGFLAGLLKSRVFRERERALLELRRLLQRFKTEIEFASKDLGELILSSRDFPLCELASGFLKEGESPKSALTKAGKKSFQTQEDLKLFLGFLQDLGVSGTKGQLEHIDLTLGLLEVNLSKAREDIEKKSRLCLVLGSFCGVLTCLVLL